MSEEKPKDEIELKEAPDNIPHKWEEITVYKERTQNREVIEFKDILTGECHFRGGIIIVVQRRTPAGIQGQPYRHEFDFPEGWTREQCFENFDSEGQKAAMLWQQQQHEAAMAARKAVVGAKQMPNQGGPQILGPKGKPMQGNRKQRRRR
jgi:hypothetical protein